MRDSTLRGTHARSGSRALAASPEFPTLVVGDLSFISLTMVLPPLVGAVGLEADYVLLVKPQFEVGRTGNPGGHRA